MPPNEAQASRNHRSAKLWFESAARFPRANEGGHARPRPGDWSLQQVLQILRRNILIIVVSVLVFLGLGTGYVLLATPKFTATAMLVLDTKRTGFFPGAPESNNSNIVDAGNIDNQIEIIKSEEIASGVVKELQLTADPEFGAPKPGTLESISEVFRPLAPKIFDRIFGPSGKPQTTEDHQLHIAITNFERLLQVGRVGHSYIAEISFTSVDPEKAARIANATADAYIDNELDTRIYNTQRADSWIRRRLVDLRHNFNAASDAVDKYNDDAADAIKDGKLTVEERDSRLNELQSTADSYKSIYDTFLNLSRYVQSVRQQSFPLTEARIITKAVPPLSKSKPKTALTLLASLALGLIVGVPLALFRGFLDRSIRTQIQVEQDIGVTCLGFIPIVKRRGRLTKSAAEALLHRGIIPLLDDCDSSAGAGEVLRLLRSAIETRMPNRQSCVIGITSALQGEGKTTLAANLATVFHEAGRRILLVDGDLRNHTISDGLAAQQGNGTVQPIEEGLYSTVSGKTKLGDVIVPGPFGWCLPVETANTLLKHPADFWSSLETRALFESAKKQYDYLIIDLPSLLLHVDAEAAAALCDTIIIVAKHGTTTVDDLERAFNEYENVPSCLLGIIVNGLPALEKRRYLKISRMNSRAKRSKRHGAPIRPSEQGDPISAIDKELGGKHNAGLDHLMSSGERVFETKISRSQG
jgi:succinoglycan biosynthesis transport protein ExoP